MEIRAEENAYQCVVSCPTMNVYLATFQTRPHRAVALERTGVSPQLARDNTTTSKTDLHRVSGFALRLLSVSETAMMR